MAKKADDPLDQDLSPAPSSASMSLDGTVTTEHCYAIHKSPRKLKRMLEDTELRIYQRKKKLKPEKEKTRRLRRKVSHLSSVIETLKESGMISEKCAEVLETSFSGIPKDLMLCVLQKDKKSGQPLSLFRGTKGFCHNTTVLFVQGIRVCQRNLWLGSSTSTADPFMVHWSRWWSWFHENGILSAVAKSEQG